MKRPGRFSSLPGFPRLLLAPFLLALSAARLRGTAGTKEGSPLPFGEINVLYTTDVHGWYSKNRRVDANPADLGDLVSLTHWLRAEADRRGADLFLADTGDYIDGAGLADITTPSGVLVWPLLLRAGYDIIGTGNHELYLNRSIEGMQEGLFKHCGEACLNSNVVWAEDGQALGGGRYRLMVGPNSGRRVLGMAFMYNMGNVAANAVRVIDVEDSLKEPWFTEAMGTKNLDGIIATVHMGLNDEEIDRILAAIREHHPTVPVIFPAGHLHFRSFSRKDDHAASIAAGANFEVEFASFSGTGSSGSRTWFEYEYIDPSVDEFVRVSGKSNAAELSTPKGDALKFDIEALREEYGLNEVIGCAAITYSRGSLPREEDSIWGVYLDEVLDFALYDPDATPNTPLLAETTGTYRADLNAGEISVDDVFIMSPFKNYYLYFEGVDGADILKLLEFVGAPLRRGANKNVHHYPSADGKRHDIASLPSWIVDREPVPGTTYDLVCTNHNIDRCVEALLEVTGEAMEPKRYVTRGEELDNSDLWFRFIRAKWKCDGAAARGAAKQQLAAAA